MTKTNMRLCKQCGLPVRWVRDGERWKCHNPDGSDHWDLCSQARFERIKREGVFFHTTREDGYVTHLKKSGVQLVRQAAKPPKRSKNGVKVVICTHGVLPWDSCPLCDFAAARPTC